MWGNYQDWLDSLNPPTSDEFYEASRRDAQRENEMEAACWIYDVWGDDMFEKRPPTPEQCERWRITYLQGLNLWAKINDQATDYKGKPQPRRADFTHRRNYMGARALWQLQNRPEEPSAPSSSFDDIPF